MLHDRLHARTVGQVRRRAIAATAIAVSSLVIATVGPNAGAQTTTVAPRGVATALRIQLHGTGFEDPTGFAPEFHGTMGAFGRVEGRLKGEPDANSTVLGISDGKLRLRAPGTFSLRTSAGTIEGKSIALLALPIILTPAGPVPSPTAFIDVEEQFTVTGGTGRFRNVTGTITMRGILPEIPAVGGKRRFIMELSGDATLQLDPAAV